MKRVLKRILLGPQPIPQWSVIGRRDPQDEIRVFLEGMDTLRDVTANSVVAALRPLTLAICLEDDPRRTARRRGRARLLFRRSADGTLLGTITLVLRDSWPAGEYHYCLFETAGHTNYCVRRPRIWFHYWMQIRAMRNNTAPYNFKLVPRELIRLLTFYICPRPVILVSVKWGDALNVFPMDLVGPTASGHFSLALRNTSPAVELMKASKQLALASPPIEYQDQVYSLGKHHRVASIDLASLPFVTEPSGTFGLPVATHAVRLREVEIHDVHLVGSHTVFLGRVLTDERRSDSPQMFHTCGFYYYFLQRQLSALANATPSE